jgi:hypothetical protein
MNTAAPTAQEELARGLRALPTRQREMLADGLEQWLDAAGFAGVPATMFFEDAGAARAATRRRPQRAARRR